jgi:S-adenosylmethionine/arginine decarboxylase-like enzyme
VPQKGISKMTTATPIQYKRIVVDGVRYYGKHLILTAQGCNDNLLSVEAIGNWVTELVDRIDMQAFGEPVVARFGEGIEVGISAVQLIHTSAIVIHTNDQSREMYLDVFSCKGFSEDDVIDHLNETFAATSVNFQILFRN